MAAAELSASNYMDIGGYAAAMSVIALISKGIDLEQLTEELIDLAEGLGAELPEGVRAQIDERLGEQF